MTGSERLETSTAAASGGARWGRSVAAGLAAGLVFAVIAGVWDYMEGASFPSLKWFIAVPFVTVAMTVWHRLTDKNRPR